MKFEIHPRVQSLILEKFPELGSESLSVSKAKSLAEMVLKSSDSYLDHPEDATAWESAAMQTAQWIYFLPLNNVRARGVLHRLQTLPEGSAFFQGLENYIDFGAGLGALPFEIENLQTWKSINLVEGATFPRDELKKQFPLTNVVPDMKTLLGKSSGKLPPQALLSFSYSLTEMSQVPPWVFDAEALLILEPSTQQDGRKLMALREQLITKGFHIWAPCLHQDGCPLLSQSGRDWCHDRFHLAPPPWFNKLEKELPMKNATLTTSYLAARKSPPPLNNSLSPRVRLVGDFLPEKGKSRQMACRGSEREFLAWLHRTVEPQEIPRGEIVELPAKFKKVSNEIRLEEPISLRTETTQTTKKN